MTVEVTLTIVEMQHAAMLGAWRQIESTRLGVKDRFGADSENGWTLNIEGAAGEMAVAKTLDRYWGMPVNTFKQGGDVGALQVRTRSRHNSDLIVRPCDRDGDVFILVTGRAPRFRIHGYAWGQQAKRACWLHDYGGRPPAYFVPQSALRPLQLLRCSPGGTWDDAVSSADLPLDRAA